jgi:hypothetical protein
MLAIVANTMSAAPSDSARARVLRARFSAQVPSTT